MNWTELIGHMPGVSESLKAKAVQAADDASGQWDAFLGASCRHTIRITRAFQDVRLDDRHFVPTTGYGYGDAGREALETVYATVFGAEAALVRQQIVSGTHALSLCLTAFLSPGDRLLSATGAPYDTLRRVIGADADGRQPGSLRDQGVLYDEVPLTKTGCIDLAGLRQALAEEPKMVLIQRSRGYSLAPSRTVAEIGKMIEIVREVAPRAVVLVDNCYGEFVEAVEPSSVGADLVAGSLIKNPGGGLAPGGGYIVGSHDLVARVAARLYAPAIGGEIGPSLTGNRLFFQGLYLAPHFVSQSLMGATFTARLAQLLGFETSPAWSEGRTDIIQAVSLGSAEALVRFCRGLQSASPVGSHIVPEPSDMPGYSDPVIMAGGTFIQGASLELSADAPLRPPFAVYIQGGFSVEQVIFAVLAAFGPLACNVGLSR